MSSSCMSSDVLQVTLYSMMMSDRHEDPEAGLLLYLRGGSMKSIPADVANQRGLLMLFVGYPLLCPISRVLKLFWNTAKTICYFK